MNTVEEHRDVITAADSSATESAHGAPGDRARPAAHGQVTRRLSWAPLRVLSIVTGVALIRGLLALAIRYLLGLRSVGTVTVEDGHLVLEARWTVRGRTIRESRTMVPLTRVAAVRLENRRSYVLLLAGFGFLAIGTWIGVQWLLEGLGAGFPLLAVLGAGVVIAGILLDLLLNFVVFRGFGRSHLSLALGPWHLRLTGVDQRAAFAVMEALRKHPA